MLHHPALDLCATRATWVEPFNHPRHFSSTSRWPSFGHPNSVEDVTQELQVLFLDHDIGVGEDEILSCIRKAF